MQRSVGDAGMTIINGTLYMGCGTWMMMICDPHEVPWLRADVLDIIEIKSENDQQSDHFVDWRLLNAKEIDLHNETFLPYGSRKHVPIINTSVLRATRDAILTLFNEMPDPMDYPRVDIIHELKSGHLHAMYDADYEPKDDLGKRKNRLAKENNTTNYIYNQDNLAVAINADYLNMAVELGFDLWLPEIYDYRGGDPPHFSGYHPDMNAMIAIAALHTGDESKTTPDGRRMTNTASRVCWTSLDGALATIRHNRSVFDPRVRGQGKVVLDLMTWRDGTYGNGFLGVDMLRWHGKPEEEIEAVLMEIQQETWEYLLEQIPEECAEMVVHFRKEPPEYNRGYMKEQARKNRKALTELRNLTGRQVDFSSLEELESLL